MKRLILMALAIVILFAITSYAENNYALKFDGENDYVSVPDSDDWAFGSGDFTIECLARFDATGTFDLLGQFSNDDHRWQLWCGGGILTISHLEGDWKYNYKCSFSPSTKTWYHIAAVRSGNNCYIYINGISQSISVHTAWQPIGDLSGDLKFGCYQGYGWLNGCLDEIRIWHCVRTEQEINDYMHNPLNGNETGLVGYWNFNEGTGQIVTDLTNRSHNGQLGSTSGTDVNDPTWIDYLGRPIANAGIDQIVNEGQEVMLDGTASHDDVDEAISKYTWSQVSGSEAVLSDIHSSKPTFTAPLISSEFVELVFSLIVEDSDYNVSLPDYVTIKVLNNEPPVAEAGDDISAKTGDIVILDGTHSYDSDGTITKYEWMSLTHFKPEGELLGSGSKINIAMPGTIKEIIQLKVTDDDGASSTDTMTIKNLDFENIKAQVEAIDQVVNPSLTITNPADGSTVTGVVPISISSDSEAKLSYCDFMVDGKLLGKVSVAPFTLSWDTKYWTNGQHIVQVTGYFDKGVYLNKTSTITVTSSNSPVITPSIAITSPTNGQTVSGTIKITTNATSYCFSGVSLYIDGKYKTVDNTAPFEFSLDTKTLTNGTHTIKVTGWHKQAAQNVSKSITITVNNI